MKFLEKYWIYLGLIGVIIFLIISAQISTNQINDLKANRKNLSKEDRIEIENKISELTLNNLSNSEFIYTIFCNDKSILQMNNCYIQTNSYLTGNSVTCGNIKTSFNHIIELIDTKLVIINDANEGSSRHI